ncbi:hypothetical protein ACFYO2_05980 [Streptomyces sp. NPDC006602]
MPAFVGHGDPQVRQGGAAADVKAAGSGVGARHGRSKSARISKVRLRRT